MFQDGENCGLTSFFYELMNKLDSIKGLVVTMHRLDMLTEDEKRVIYHNMHNACLEKMRDA